MIKVNEYFEGSIRSLGFESEGNLYTVGVMLPGKYSFSTEKEEYITVTVGEFEIHLPSSDWRTIKTGETIVVPAQSNFDVHVTKCMAYTCKYM